MNFDLRWRLLLTLVVLVLSVWAISPPAEKIHLGLDLRGGIHMVMRVKTDDAVRAEIDLSQERIRAALGEKGLAPQKVAADGINALILDGVDAARTGEIRDLLARQFPQYQIASSGQGRLRAQLKPADESGIRDSAVRQALETIRTRVDRFGVAEPNIQREGGSHADRILVQLPGVEDPERVKDLIGSPAFLEWKLVKVPPGVVADQFRPPDNLDALAKMFGGTLPEDVEALPQDVVGQDGKPVQIFWPVTKSSPITGNDLKNARRDQDRFGGPAVNFLLTADAGRRFQELTRKNQGQLLAILLDRKIISAPRINAVISDQGIIEGGNFTLESSEDLALKLRSGALPAGMEVLEERTVGPSLGADSVRQGVIASIIGSIIVILFMLVYYRMAGVNAVFGLACNILILLAAMAYFKSTLTLPGIAGIALTIGMSVDANVLIFERIREEMRNGRTVKAAITAGFEKALVTIIDSHVTTVIPAFFLYSKGTGSVRGFALTLIIGIVVNLYTAVFVSRALFDTLLTLRPRMERLSI